jgi:YVTN family beta-propeller protein
MVLARSPLPPWPGTPVIDPRNGYVYIPVGSGNITVLRGSVQLGVIPGQGPYSGSAFDPSNGYLYFLGQNDLLVVCGLRALADISVGPYATSVLYDPADGSVYVASESFDLVVVVHGLRVIATIQLYGAECLAGEAYDPIDTAIYVVDQCVGNLYLIKGTYLVNSWYVGSNPTSVAYDPADQTIYVSLGVFLFGWGYLLLFRGSTQVGNVTVGCGPGAGVYNSQNGLLYVENTCSANISVVRSDYVVASLATPGASGPLVLDPATGYVYVPAGAGIWVFDGLVQVASVDLGAGLEQQNGIDGIAFDLPEDELYATTSNIFESNGTLSIIGPGPSGVPVTFGEVGLIPGTSWNVSINATLGNTTVFSASATVAFALPPGSYVYAVQVPWGYVCWDPEGTLNVPGSGLSVSIGFTLPPAPAGPHEVASVPTGAGPEAEVYDPADGYVYVTAPGPLYGNNLAVIDGATLLGIVPVGFGPMSIVYDAADGSVYVVSLYSNQVNVVNGTTVVANVTLSLPCIVYGLPTFEAYDPGDADVYVAASGCPVQHRGPAQLVVLHGTSIIGYVPLPSMPGGPTTYDASDGSLVVAAGGELFYVQGTSVVSTLLLGLPKYNGVTDMSYNPSNGYLYVAESTNTVAVLDGTTFVTNLSLGWTLGSIAVDPLTGAEYITGCSYVNYTCFGQGAEVIGTGVVATFALGFGPAAAVTDPADGLVYVPNYGSDNTSVLEGGLVLASVSVGSGPWSAVADPTNGFVYVTDTLGGNESVLSSSALYGVTFESSGLLPGTPWSVTMAGIAQTTNLTSVTFVEPNGTYPYSIAGPPVYTLSLPSFSGTTAVDGASFVQPVAFSPGPAIFYRYDVSFHEVGLPAGLNWSVLLGSPVVGRTNLSAPGGGNVVFLEPNGTFSYSIWAPTGYGVARISGPGHPGLTRLIVRGASFFTVTFGPLEPVSFSERGLAGGTWTVAVDGQTNSSPAGSSITFWLVGGGDYACAVGKVAGYFTLAGHFAVVVHARPASVVITFFPVRPHPVLYVPSSFTGVRKAEPLR